MLNRARAAVVLMAVLACSACAYLPGMSGPDWTGGNGTGGGGAGGTNAGEPGAGQPREGSARTRPPVFYWCVTTDENELKWRSKVDWAQRVDFDGAPIRKDIYIFYGQFLGNYPSHGLHQVIGRGEMEAHLEKVKRDVEARLPAAFGGPVCIDYENWALQWDRLANEASKDGGPDAADRDFKDDWREHLASVTAGWGELSPERREQLAKATYDKAAREFFLKTLSVCKATRPRALWGFYDFPGALYGGNEAPAGRIGYTGEARGIAAERNDQLAWLFDAVDVVFPTVYCPAYTVPAGENAAWKDATNTIEQNREYTVGNVREAVRLAKGKPVIAFMWPRYQRPGSKYHEQFLNDINLEQAIELPLEAGADGIAIWEAIHYAAEFQPLQEYVRTKLGPAVKRAAAKKR
ncbi:MAG: hypothetical protein IT436_02010 [Phycisphaerales bacterium]|nr:hypothetical protein [Phycisphaerales bacterium]